MRGQVRLPNMVGVPGSSKGCTTCKRRKVRVSHLPYLTHYRYPKSNLSLTSSPPTSNPLKEVSPSAISRPHIALAAPTPKGSARGMSRTGGKAPPKRLSNRLPTPVSPPSLAVPMPLTIRSSLSSGRGISLQRMRAFRMALPAAGFSTSYLPRARQTQTFCSCRSRL